MAMLDWVRLPSGWIEEKRLRELRWGENGSANIAALMVLAVIAHHATGDMLIAHLTYDALETTTGLSRAKISAGLKVLEAMGLISRLPEGRSTYRITDYDAKRGWAKLPAKRLYASGRFVGFKDFNLRSLNELNAMKLYFLFASRRENGTNLARISYDKIEVYTGMDRSRIKTALSLLANVPLIQIEHTASNANEHGVSCAYRLVGLDNYVHMGTRGRSADAFADQVVAATNQPH